LNITIVYGYDDEARGRRRVPFASIHPDRTVVECGMWMVGACGVHCAMMGIGGIEGIGGIDMHFHLEVNAETPSAVC
jgi:hypothetical protein